MQSITAATGAILESQRKDVVFWDTWNSQYRQPEALDEPSKRRMREVVESLSRVGVRRAKILEIGCGTGWLSAKLKDFGPVTAVDLAVEVIRAAKSRVPEIDFRSGDVFELQLPIGSFDVVVTLETLSHVSDQAKFVCRISELLKRGGYLVLTTQNKFVFDRRGDVVENPRYIRKWVTMRTLKQLLGPQFCILRATSLEPEGYCGVLRIINSHKLTRTLELAMGRSLLKRLKECAGLGQTLFLIAVKR